MAADDDRQPSAAGRGIGVVAHRQRGDLEPERPVDAGIAGAERVRGREAAPPADVLVHAVGRDGGPQPDPQPHQRPSRRADSRPRAGRSAVPCHPRPPAAARPGAAPPWPGPPAAPGADCEPRWSGCRRSTPRPAATARRGSRGAPAAVGGGGRGRRHPEVASAVVGSGEHVDRLAAEGDPGRRAEPAVDGRGAAVADDSPALVDDVRLEQHADRLVAADADLGPSRRTVTHTVTRRRTLRT